MITETKRVLLNNNRGSGGPYFIIEDQGERLKLISSDMCWCWLYKTDITEFITALQGFNNDKSE
jgi:hypothetical protein